MTKYCKDTDPFKFIHKFNNPIKIIVFEELAELTFYFKKYMDNENSGITRPLFKNKSKDGGLTMPDIKT